MEQIAINLLSFLGNQKGLARFDSRLLWSYERIYADHVDTGGNTGKFVSHIERIGAKRPYGAWVHFMHRYEQELGSLGEFELRSGDIGGKFAMLNNEQACILILFSQVEREFITFAAYVDFLKQFRSIYLHSFVTPLEELVLYSLQNKTFEEKEAEKKAQKTREGVAKEKTRRVKKIEAKTGPEKKIEIALGKQLEAQGIPVQYQVTCKNGVADIVTPDAIYEIKSHFSRTNFYNAIGQVLGYRACINPSARAVVVGKKHKNDFVNIEFARSVGVEIIVWNEEPEQGE